MDRSDVIVPMIEYYIGGPIDSMEMIDSIVFFSTSDGNGKICENEIGNWEVYVNEEKVSEIEEKVFKTIMDSKECLDIQNYYDDLKDILGSDLTYRSSCLIRDIMGSLEYLLINEDVKIKSPVNMGKYFIFTLDNGKEIICLN